jgi:hypothetical protein
MGDNSKARHDIIREIKFGIDDVNSRMAILSEERKRLKGRIKADLGWKVSDFNFAVRLADLEEGERDDAIDVMREAFQALDIGVQLNFLDIIAPEPEPATKKKRGKTKAEKIAEAVLATEPTPEAVEIAEQKAADAAAFDQPTDEVDEFLESEEALQPA